MQDGSLAVTGELPGRDVGVAVVVAQRLAVLGLRLGPEVAAAGLAPVERVDAHQLAELEEVGHPAVREAQESVRQRVEHFMGNNGTRSVDSYHRELGNIMWEYCGMERTEDGLKKAIDLIRGLRDDFWRNVKVLGTADSLNQSLERAGRVADFFELGELMCIDALNRRESCGGHFRAESQTEEGEAMRHDDQYAYVAAWEWAGEDEQPILHKEQLTYEFVEMKQRSYK